MEGMPWNVRIRLSVMMFLQYMMFAVFWVPLSRYLEQLGVNKLYTALIMSTMPLGCLIAPVVCMIADRHFSSQKVLIVLNVACAGLLFLAAGQTNPPVLFTLLLLGTLCYMPTWGITNGIAMTHSPSEKFPQIRVFGSIGWVASAVFGLVASLELFGGRVIEDTAIPLYCGAGTALVAAMINLTLPDTPPPAKGKESSVVDALGLRALTLLKDPKFAMFIVISMLVMIPFTMYFSFGSRFFGSQGYDQITARMNLGQVSEMLVMLLVPMALLRLGAKWTMALGLAALLVRYVAFWAGGACGLPGLYYVAILVHGVIYGCFFVGGQVYVDKKAPPEIRAQAQGLIVLICFGVGMLVATFFNAWLIDVYTTGEAMIKGVMEKTYNWDMIWIIMVAMSAVLLGVFCVFFWDDVSKKSKAQADV